jgi:hypothetical protein
MNVQRLMALATALAALKATAYAGSCADEIVRMEARINAKLGTVARTGPSAAQSREAGMHRQPTPSSIAGAESRLGELSPGTLEAAKSPSEDFINDCRASVT